ncbi:MAG: MotA/TolQ/ExbB proton channel family protein [Deltaproteobacteria bacterium]|nr:MAG: MotA/TolQ/ExbB proton channel family protein [Deltaproteobacteria bacterium]
MDLTSWLEQIMVGFGAGWVMWLLLFLSVVSVAIILERAWFFNSLRDDLTQLAGDLRKALGDSVEAARKRMSASPSAEAAVVLAGLALHNRGADAAEEAMAGAAALQRMKLEKRLAYLATVGNNAPFIGLFGTVIGVVGAFKALGEQSQVPVAEAAQVAIAPQQVMSSISEALVATAVGIAVAIPAVAANNYFQRSTKRVLANTEALSKVLLAHLKSVPADDDPSGAEDEPKDARGKSRKQRSRGDD